MGEKNAEIFVQNEYTQCFLLDIVNIVIVVQSAQYKALDKSILDYELFGKSQINIAVSTVHIFVLGTCTEKSYRTEPICVDQFTLLSFLWSMPYNFSKGNLLILNLLYKSEQRRNVIFEERFFCAVQSVLYQRVYKTERSYRHISFKLTFWQYILAEYNENMTHIALASSLIVECLLTQTEYRQRETGCIIR